MTDIVEHVNFLRSWATDIRKSSGQSVDADKLDAIALALSEARATGRREGMEEAAKWHDDECHRLREQIKENLRYMSTHGLRGSTANDYCREEIITHKLSATAIRAAMEKAE